MTTIEEQLKHLNDVRLPEGVRARMREELLAYAALHTSPAMPARSPFSYFTFRLYAGVAAVLLIIVTLGGTAYASEDSLPGDILYPVKVGIAEPIQTALVPSDRGKAAWHAILAERRLEETAQLAAQGRLSPEVQNQLAANFDAQVDASQESAARLEDHGDTTSSLTVRSDLEARLSAHEQILTVISAHFALSTSTEAKTTHTALERMLTLVTDHEHNVISARLALEDSLMPSRTASTTTAKTKVALAPHLRFGERMTPASMQVEAAAQDRSDEQAHILERNATFLAKFMPVATSTATSTMATTTATTTEEAEIQHTGNDEDGGVEEIDN